MKTTELLWACSLICIGICTIILAGANILSLALPELLIRLLGVIDLAALPVLAYTTVKKWMNKQQ